MPAGRMDFPYHVGFFLRGYGYDPHGPVLKVAGRDIAIHKNGDIPVSVVCPEGRKQIFDGSVFALDDLCKRILDKQKRARYAPCSFFARAVLRPFEPGRHPARLSSR